MFQASGPASRQINVLWWIMFGVGSLVYLVVMAYMLLALFRRRGNLEERAEPTEGSNVVFWGGAVIPALILVGIFGATVYTQSALREPEIPEDLVVEVVGHQWWWEVRYPEYGFTTANEIHLPVGQPVSFRILSDDVIHSFWVPELHGKLDAIPEQTNSFWLQADEPGFYWGECAEYCGLQHARMLFVVIAEAEGEFLEWVEGQQQPAVEPVNEQLAQGRQIFLDSNCINCHAIEGTDATGELGPDLTHLASRRTLGAGTVPNNRGNLGGWIMDPHGIKEGVLMPPADYTGEELQLLLDYLQSLE